MTRIQRLEKSLQRRKNFQERITATLDHKGFTAPKEPLIQCLADNSVDIEDMERELAAAKAKQTYTVVLRESRRECDYSSPIIASCGHKHKTREAASDCARTEKSQNTLGVEAHIEGSNMPDNPRPTKVARSE